MVLFIRSVFAIGNLYVGIRLKHLLTHKPELPVKFAFLSLLFAIAVPVISSFTTLGGRVGLVSIIWGLLTMGLDLYIWVQIRRLAAQADTPVETRVMS